MAPRIIARRDLDFLIFDWLGTETLLAARAGEMGREDVSAILDMAFRLAESEFLSHYKQSDRQEPRLEADGVKVLPEVGKAVRAFAEAGFVAGPFASPVGGLELPEIVHAAVMATFMAANVATTAYPMLTIGNARLVSAFGTPEQIEAFVLPQLSGHALGTMCLSEPEAGSSLGDITTRAIADGADARGQRYRLRGNKMWISGGDNDIAGNIFHLVLAKIADETGPLPASSAGTSLFIVPKLLDGGDANDVVVAGLNHKMGYRGTSNCLLNFGEGQLHRPGGRSGAIGYLIGQPGKGLAVMFHMMNEARIAVGLGAAAVGYRSHLLSVDYALERRQGRVTSDRTAHQAPIAQHPDVRRMLIAQKSYVEGALALVLYSARLIDELHAEQDSGRRDAVRACLDILTPVAKTWPSEYGLAACDIAIQIHGGYGYTRDFDVEQLYRDNRLNPIHEGTTGIQGLDLVGRKIRKERAAGLQALGARVDATLDAVAGDGELAPLGVDVDRVWRSLQESASILTQRGDAEATWHATDFLRAFGHVVVAWLWLDMALAARRLSEDGQPCKLHEAKTRTAQYFIETELPNAAVWLDLVKSGTGAAANFPLEYFDP